MSEPQKSKLKRLDKNNKTGMTTIRLIFVTRRAIVARSKGEIKFS